MKRGSILVVISLLILPLVYATNISSCTAITTSDFYTLNTSLVSSDGNNCIVISTNNIILNLNGFNVNNASNNNQAAIRVDSSTINVSIWNGTVNGSYFGIILRNSLTVEIRNITALNNSQAGIYINNSNSSQIITNRATNTTQYGFFVDRGFNNTLRNNNASRNRKKSERNKRTRSKNNGSNRRTRTTSSKYSTSNLTRRKASG